MRKFKKGFTLVEIMIVVVIIGLLAVLAIPAFNRVRRAAQTNSVMNNLRQIANAADQYYLATGETSVTIASLTSTTIANGPYIKAITPVANEVYTAMPVINQGFTSLTINVPGLGNDVVYTQ